jgi:hypothetical protein
MTVLTLFLYLVILILAHGGPDINEALNHVADTLLFAEQHASSHRPCRAILIAWGKSRIYGPIFRQAR